MNILEAFDLTLPEIPALRAGKAFPRLDPRVVAREQIEGGKTVVVAHLRGGSGLCHLTPVGWRISQLMDGQRSYQEIAEACRHQGYDCTEQEVRDFTEAIRETELIYKSPAERNLTLKQKTASERRKVRKLKFGDLSEVTIAHWDPDQLLTKVYPWVKFIYTPWFVLSTLLAFCVMLALCIDRWTELARDTFLFFNYFNEGPADLL